MGHASAASFNTGSDNIKREGNKATSKDGSRGYAMWSESFSSGKGTWKFKIDKDNVNDQRICLGFGIKPVTDVNYDKSPQFWTYRGYNGKLYPKGNCQNAPIYDKFCTGDEIRFNLDHDAHTVSMEHNGVNKGVIFKDVPSKPIFPLIAFYGASVSASLVEISGDTEAIGEENFQHISSGVIKLDGDMMVKSSNTYKNHAVVGDIIPFSSNIQETFI